MAKTCVWGEQLTWELAERCRNWVKWAGRWSVLHQGNHLYLGWKSHFCSPPWRLIWPWFAARMRPSWDALRQVQAGDRGSQSPEVGAWPGLQAQPLAWEQGWQPRKVFHCILEAQIGISHQSGCLHLSSWSKAGIKSLSLYLMYLNEWKHWKWRVCPYVVSALQWQTWMFIHMKALSHCKTVLNGFRASGSQASKGINSLSQIFFMQFPILSFSYLSCSQFFKGGKPWLLSSGYFRSGWELRGPQKPFLCYNPMADVEICWPHGQ